MVKLEAGITALHVDLDSGRTEDTLQFLPENFALDAFWKRAKPSARLDAYVEAICSSPEVSDLVINTLQTALYAAEKHGLQSIPAALYKLRDTLNWSEDTSVESREKAVRDFIQLLVEVDRLATDSSIIANLLRDPSLMHF